MKAKDRVTAFICPNADGSQKVPITLIRTSKNPRAFKKNKPPCYYYSTKKAWSNGHIFQKWLDKILLKLDKIALIIDKVTCHGKVTNPSRLNIIPLSLNLISIHQPMDMGIIRQ